MLKSFNNKITNYLSLVKFAHTIFALPFAMIGYFLAITRKYQSFDAWLFISVILCMIFARNAAMAFNRYTDRELDKKNPRTASREIPAEKIKPKSALLFVILNSVLFILTTFFINRLVFFLSPVALFVVLAYSYTKRFTWLSHLILGTGLSLAPTGAYLAVTGEFNWLPVLFSLIVLFWVAGFDIIYSLQDEDFDKSQKLKSAPVFMGVRNAMIVSIILHFISGALVILIGLTILSGVFYWIGAAIFNGLLIYQHIIVKPSDLNKINLAFFTTNGVASVIYAVFVIIGFYFNSHY